MSDMNSVHKDDHSIVLDVVSACLPNHAVITRLMSFVLYGHLPRGKRGGVLDCGWD